MRRFFRASAVLAMALTAVTAHGETYLDGVVDAVDQQAIYRDGTQPPTADQSWEHYNLADVLTLTCTNIVASGTNIGVYAAALETHLVSVSNEVNVIQTNTVDRTGTRGMQANLQMGGNSITNLDNIEMCAGAGTETFGTRGSLFAGYNDGNLNGGGYAPVFFGQTAGTIDWGNSPASGWAVVYDLSGIIKLGEGILPLVWGDGAGGVGTSITNVGTSWILYDNNGTLNFTNSGDACLFGLEVAAASIWNLTNTWDALGYFANEKVPYTNYCVQADYGRFHTDIVLDSTARSLLTELNGIETTNGVLWTGKLDYVIGMETAAVFQAHYALLSTQKTDLTTFNSSGTVWEAEITVLESGVGLLTNIVNSIATNGPGATFVGPITDNYTNWFAPSWHANTLLFLRCQTGEDQGRFVFDLLVKNWTNATDNYTILYTGAVADATATQTNATLFGSTAVAAGEQIGWRMTNAAATGGWFQVGTVETYP